MKRPGGPAGKFKDNNDVPSMPIERLLYLMLEALRYVFKP
ncbi:unnamed protein product [Penicillium roqueforti FM164]|uniref:Genomic scaffold, ProqFM164S01 n=1 Tax=Penicillium roqueforti (strain FM164) TaxID=1365484 RepID=W6PUL3_PENRF|nr:unnamed protein product [Penicillium roqueforti FM164]